MARRWFPVETIERDVEQYFMGVYNRRFSPEKSTIKAPAAAATWLLESFHE